MAKKTAGATILAPDQPVSGLSQAQLGDEWWKTMYAIPLEDHFAVFDDASDPRGRRGSMERALTAQFDDSVLFIGGAFGSFSVEAGVTTLERTIVLPSDGKATVFYPLLNEEADNLTNDPAGGGLTVEELQAKARFDLNPSSAPGGGLVSDLFASVDGTPVVDPYIHWQASGTPFSFTSPFPTEGSLLKRTGYTDESYLRNAGEAAIPLWQLPRERGSSGPTITIDPAVSDGYWLAVDIAGGDHRLTFGGEFSADGTVLFALNITYNILNPIYGTNGKDVITGTFGNDYNDGANGKDDLFGDQGDDLLVGGNGNDVIDGGAGKDELWGDAGKDTFVFRAGYGEDAIFDFSRGDTVKVRGMALPPSVSTINGVFGGTSAVQYDFGNNDILTFVGVEAAHLRLNQGSISFI